MVRTMTSLRLLLTTSMTLTFIVLASQMIFQPPLYAIVDRRGNVADSSNALKNLMIDAISPKKSQDQPEHYFIFDATSYDGDLQFLNALSDKWDIFVVNLANKTNILTCDRCQILNKLWIKEFIEAKLSKSKWASVPNYAKEKMAAVVYALLQGAEWIYLTELPFLPAMDMIMKLCSYGERTGPVFRGPGQVFEPCAHFMDPYVWYGRRIPDFQGQYKIRTVSPDSIYSMVSDCYKPHMDVNSWTKSIDSQTPRPFITVGTFGNVNFRDILVSKYTAWSLVAALTERTQHSSDLTRRATHLNLMVQRLIWDTRSMIGFLSVTQSNKRVPSCSSCEVHSILQKIGSSHLKWLLDWQCKPSHNLLKCFTQLVNDMDKNVYDSDIKIILEVWVDLFTQHTLPVSEREPLTHQRIIEADYGIHVQLTAAKSMHLLNDQISLPPNVFADLCQLEEKSPKYAPEIPAEHPIKDILLVVIFNFPWLVAHIPTLEYLYGRHFRHVLYCAESFGDFRKFYADRFAINPVSFVEIPHRAGYWGYDCMSAAVRAGYQVSGYLQISDDVILNVWNLHSLPREMPWFQSSIRVAHIDRKIVPDVWVNKYWWPWTLFCGQPGAVRAYEHLRSLLSDTEQTGERVAMFLDNLYSVTGSERCLVYEASDIYYLPASMGHDFVFFGDIFSRNQVFLEIAIPSILVGLVTDAGIYRLRGSYLWFQDRDRCPFVYTQFDHFYHAWKLSKIADPAQSGFYCREVLFRIDRDLML